MTTSGTVRFWRDEDGWGVIDSPETPGGCWTHFSAVRVHGYVSLAPGQNVELEWQSAQQDGYRSRAVRVWPVGQDPVEHIDSPSGSAYRSRLTLRWNRDDPA